jgi:altronate dehydratase
MSNPWLFRDVARLAAPADNTAVVTRRLEADDEIQFQGRRRRPGSTVLEGHRIAVRPIPAGDELLSWGLPFGRAIRDIGAMEYVCNSAVLRALQSREIPASLPSEPNFSDLHPKFALDEARFRPAPPVPRKQEDRYFRGFPRGPHRGAGTRNYIVLLGTTAESAGFVSRLAHRLRALASGQPNIDGIVPVTHTEGNIPGASNQGLLLRTLAGFMIHPNVGAILAVDRGWEPASNAALKAYMTRHGYPLQDVIHAFLSLENGFDVGLRRSEAILRGWLGPLNRMERQSVPLESLALALQCGGSDTFSGISGNPLAAELGRQTIEHGGAAALAETTELMGAESYMLQKVRDIDVARRFLEKIAAYKALAEWHGETIEENVSGGNKIRGLYNITLKSIGAARKRHPLVRLESVLEYGERLKRPGLTFMDSPGADLESVAGQVAAGCNLILFTTGNGSVTNFPFVPTLKIVTTSGRFRLLRAEMDINAGRYLEGETMAALSQESFELMLAVASGQRTKGERQGNAQSLIWRNWQQKGPPASLREGALAPPTSGLPLQVGHGADPDRRRFMAMRNRWGWAGRRLGLILPASLCSAQIAVLAAERLNARADIADFRVSRFIALPHSEGCTTLGPAEKLATRALLGYLQHPLVACAFLLEHGCEKTHNSYLRRKISQKGLDPTSFGWGSVQLDGGLESVFAEIEGWARAAAGEQGSPEERPVGLETVSVGLAPIGEVPEPAALALTHFIRRLLASGATCILPMNTSLLSQAAFREGIDIQGELGPTLPYGGRPEAAGLHLMQSPTLDLAETLTGLGAAGVHIFFCCTTRGGISGHPFIPTVHVDPNSQANIVDGADLRLRSEDSPRESARRLMDLMFRVLRGEYLPRANLEGDTRFQLARGAQGLSL